jgi:ABC-type dipeptide/oligopeptide/nickel transport system permease component
MTSSRPQYAAKAVFCIMALTVTVANFIGDVLYGCLDPRIRYD